VRKRGEGASTGTNTSSPDGNEGDSETGTIEEGAAAEGGVSRWVYGAYPRLGCDLGGGLQTRLLGMSSALVVARSERAGPIAKRDPPCVRSGDWGRGGSGLQRRGREQ